MLWLTLFVCLVHLGHVFAAPSTKDKVCGPSFKRTEDGSCIPLNDDDVIRGLRRLTSPPRTPCQKTQTTQDLAVCEDNLPKQCTIWSMISSTWCDHYGSLEFEIYWAKRGCSVTLFHFTSYFKGNICAMPAGIMKEHPNINIVRYDMWGGKCFNCFYRVALDELSKLSTTAKIDILKIHGRDGVEEDLDGVQYSTLSDLYIHVPMIVEKVEQIVFITAINTRTLTDSVGREAEHAWNMWATSQLLSSYACYSLEAGVGLQKQLPSQFDYLLSQADIPTNYGYYRTSYIKVTSLKAVVENQKALQTWQPKPKTKLTGHPPGYCRVPNAELEQQMQTWINREINIRCHPTRLWVPCARDRQYEAFVPCRQELMNHLAEDYAISKQWCDFHHPKANIKPLTKVDSGAKLAFNQPALKRNEKVRLAFFFTVYTDAGFVTRLLNHLYSSDHYYLLHIDPVGSSYEFETALRQLIKSNPAFQKNVFLTKDVPIVYGAATATILLTRAMAWFHHFTTGWDYFVPLTGSDYPLLPLHRIEKIFTYQNPPMPFVMAWTPGTSTHLFRLQKTHPVFEEHPLLARSIKAVTDERGAVLGAVPMEYRSGNFGPPLFCNNRSSFYHLDNRFNKTNKFFDTQWLFPRDVFPGRGRAYAEENKVFATPSFDNEWRVWKKSDPATTGAYDRLSIEYIVSSIEGKKYWHFFKHMLLGSEEHYYVSLLYNWPRTRAFVQTLSSQIVWNTWELGLWEMSGGFQTHTHFLTLNEWDIIRGFSLRGMMFARKFSTKKTAALLNRIDTEILFNSTTEAGLYWPGFYEVDTITPGKQWVAAHRKTASQRAAAIRSGDKAAMMEGRLAMGLYVGNVSVLPRSVTSDSEAVNNQQSRKHEEAAKRQFVS